MRRAVMAAGGAAASLQRAVCVSQRRQLSFDAVLCAKPILQRFSLADRVCLVTGGAQGIGRAFAHAMIEAGAQKVAILDQHLGRAQSVAHELVGKATAHGVQAIAIECDVSSRVSVLNAVTETEATLGPLNVAVNCAGIVVSSVDNNSEQVPEEQYDRSFAVNTKGVFLCCQAQANSMLPRGQGKIINVASMSGSVVNEPQKQSVYNASKAATVMLTKSLAAEWAARGLRVNSISPGYVDSALNDRDGIRELKNVWLSRTPNRRMAVTTDLTGALILLASEAGDHIVGADIIIDGGYSLW